MKVEVKSLSRVQLFTTTGTAAHQAPPSMGFSRQEYWSGLPLPSPSEMDEDLKKEERKENNTKVSGEARGKIIAHSANCFIRERLEGNIGNGHQKARVLICRAR